MKNNQSKSGSPARHRSRARFRDIAALAGVSVPTVDRVLNDRGNVRPKTADRVIDAARKLQLNRILPVTPTRVLHYEALLVRPDQPLFYRLNDAFLRAGRRLGSGLVVHRTFVEEFDSEALNQRILQAAGTRDGLIVYSVDDPKVTAAIQQAARMGLPVIALVTDLDCHQEVTFVGIDNYRAGRTAAFFTGRFASRDGVVLVLCGSTAYRAQSQRVAGFLDALSERFPTLVPTPIVEGRIAGTKRRAWLSKHFARAEISWPSTTPAV